MVEGDEYSVTGRFAAAAASARGGRCGGHRARVDDRGGHLRRAGPGGRGGRLGAAGRARRSPRWWPTATPRRRRGWPPGTRQSGGTYVYGRERLGPFWGYLAGWAFVVGKTASLCGDGVDRRRVRRGRAHAHAVAVGAVVALTAVNYRGVQKTALADPGDRRRGPGGAGAVVVVVGLSSGRADVARLATSVPTSAVGGVLQAAGLLFFAFAGYARIATLGRGGPRPGAHHPARDPAGAGHHFGRLRSGGGRGAGGARRRGPGARRAPRWPTRCSAAGVGWLVPVVQVGAAIAALGSLLALVFGVSRTTLAMARDRHLPHVLAAVHPRFKVPAPRRAGRRRRRGGGRGNRRRTGRDRVLLVRSAGLLRDRQRRGVDPDPG